MQILSEKYVKLPPPEYESTEITSNSKYYPYFSDCIGALDGTHVPVFVRQLDQAAYRNRKVNLTQNVLAVCSFDLQFTHIYAGWEGSANDQCVLNDAIGRNIFQVPAGKYYLADAGYVCSDILLTPYRGYRYHVREQLNAKVKPACKEELFNLRHAQLRNAIERVFGVSKRRFPILGKVYESLDMVKQRQIVYACTGLHNFIREHAKELDIFDIEGRQRGDEEARENAENSIRSTVSSVEQRGKMETFRDQVASEMWKDYCDYIQRRGEI